MGYSKKDVEAVMAALENEKYDWRTLRGIARETGLPKEKILGILAQEKDSIIQSPTPSDKGEELYTTRNRYLDTASPAQKFIWSLKNRLD
jgi:hypothetical protein